VLQFAAINYLMTEELKKTTRVMAVWSKKLEALGWWYDQLLSESLGKNNRGGDARSPWCKSRDLPQPRPAAPGRHARTSTSTNVIVKQGKHPPVMIGMADRKRKTI